VLGACCLFVMALALVGVWAEVARAQTGTFTQPPNGIVECTACNMTVCNGTWQCANVASNRQRAGAPTNPSSPNACQAENDSCARLLDWSLGFSCWREVRGCGGQLAYIYIQ